MTLSVLDGCILTGDAVSVWPIGGSRADPARMR